MARALTPGKRPRFKNKLFSLDATILELRLEMFNWAKYQPTKGAIKLHVLLDHHEGFGQEEKVERYWMALQRQTAPPDGRLKGANFVCVEARLLDGFQG